MATQTVCSFYRFGYCKHKELCRKRHVKEICENIAFKDILKYANGTETIKTANLTLAYFYTKKMTQKFLNLRRKTKQS